MPWSAPILQLHYLVWPNAGAGTRLIIHWYCSMDTPPSPSKTASQKLVTVYLDNTAYGKAKTFVGGYADKHGFVEEHLSDLLGQGWRVAAIHGFGGSAEGICARGWITVLLEKTNTV